MLRGGLLRSLRPVVFDSLVVTHGAAGGGAQNTVMTRDVTGNTTDRRTAQATGRLCRSRRQRERADGNRS